MSAHQYDVIIQGAGMVGLALAAALLRQGRRVALLESRAITRFDGGEMRLRVSALSLASEQMLRRLGAWETMQRLRVSPYRGMRVWDAEGGGEIGQDAGDDEAAGADGEGAAGQQEKTDVHGRALRGELPTISMIVESWASADHESILNSRIIETCQERPMQLSRR